MQPTIREANLNSESDGKSIIDLLNSYAEDPFGGGKPLPVDVQKRLIPGLQSHPTTIVLIAFDGTKPVGLATCFLGFSTFQARPLLNIHDFAVIPEYRSRGVGKSLMRQVEKTAIERGCCKLTLEVLDDNVRAIGLYENMGFANYSLRWPSTGGHRRKIDNPFRRSPCQAKGSGNVVRFQRNLNEMQ